MPYWHWLLLPLPFLLAWLLVAIQYKRHPEDFPR